MITELVSYNGYLFGTHEDEAIPTWAGMRGQWSFRTRIVPVAGARARATGGETSERRLDVDLVVGAEGEDFPVQLDAVAGALGLADPTPRPLVARWHDDTLVETLATVEQRPATDESADTLYLTFVAADPFWRKQAPATAAQALVAGGGAALPVPLTNSGSAPATLTIQFAGDDNGLPNPTGNLLFRRVFTVTNAGDETWPALAVRVPLGNTEPWVDNFWGAGEDGEGVYLFDKYGVEHRREFVNFNSTVSYMWMVVAGLGPGLSREYRLIYGQPIAATPLDFSSTTAAKRAAPVFDTSWEHNVSTAVTSTTLTRTGAGWQTDQWAGGDLQYLDGPAIGQSRPILANTPTVVTVASAFSPAPATGNAYLITMSRTDRYVWPVRETERNDFKRGLWWINRGQNTPSRRSHDGPGAWRPVLTLDNNDDKAARVWSEIDVGTEDYFAIPDLLYTWDGGAPFDGELEPANAVQFSSVLPITAWTAGWQSQNPNGVAKLVLGMKESGATDWETITEHAAHSDTLVDTAADTFSTVPVEGETKHLLFEARPWNDTEIPLDWIKDTGTSTSGTTTQLNDNTKAWQSDQFNTGTIYLRGGVGSPAARTISNSGPNFIEVGSAFPADIEGDTRYEVRNKPLVANFRSLAPWYVDLDAGDVVVSAVGAEEENYDMHFVARLDGGVGGTDPHVRVRFGVDADGHRVMHATGQAVRLDGERRVVEIVEAATGGVLETLAVGYVVERVNADGSVVEAPDWFAMAPGAHTLYLEEIGDVGGDLALEWTEGYPGV